MERWNSLRASPFIGRYVGTIDLHLYTASRSFSGVTREWCDKDLKPFSRKQQIARLQIPTLYILELRVAALLAGAFRVTLSNIKPAFGFRLGRFSLAAARSTPPRKLRRANEGHERERASPNDCAPGGYCARRERANHRECAPVATYIHRTMHTLVAFLAIDVPSSLLVHKHPHFFPALVVRSRSLLVREKPRVGLLAVVLRGSLLAHTPPGLLGLLAGSNLPVHTLAVLPGITHHENRQESESVDHKATAQDKNEQTSESVDQEATTRGESVHKKVATHVESGEADAFRTR